MRSPIVFLLVLGVHTLRVLFRTREDLLIENLALRQQVIALKKKRPRPLLDDMDRAFWVALRAAWPGWANRLFIVNPDTIAKWNRDRFRRYWAKISQHKAGPGRPPVDAEIRSLIRTMARDDWGAPRIHGELLKLGFVVSEITVSRYMPRGPTDADKIKRWVAFLRNHKDAIAAMDFFTVPTVSLKVLYIFLVIEHSRRHVLHFNATFNPTAVWVTQQLREAFPYDTAPKYLIFDRDAIFNPAVVDTVRAMGIKPCRIAYRSPWQNGVAERWIGSCRRELLAYVIVFGRRHLLRLMRAYIDYYHKDRCHLGLDKNTPHERPVAPRRSSTAKVVALPRVGGLHHRYEWREAA
jgi:transposase InsO family protein